MLRRVQQNPRAGQDTVVRGSVGSIYGGKLGRFSCDMTTSLVSPNTIQPCLPQTPTGTVSNSSTKSTFIFYDLIWNFNVVYLDGSIIRACVRAHGTDGRNCCCAVRVQARTRLVTDLPCQRAPSALTLSGSLPPFKSRF